MRFNHSCKWSSAGALAVLPKQHRRSGTIRTRRNQMSLKANLSPHLQQVGSPYCSDRNCVYCSDLRKTQEQLKDKYTITPSVKKAD